MEDKKGKKPNAKRTQYVTLVAERPRHQRDVGKPQEPIFVPRGLNMMNQPMMTQMTKENPRSLLTLENPPQANPLLKT